MYPFALSVLPINPLLRFIAFKNLIFGSDTVLTREPFKNILAPTPFSIFKAKVFIPLLKVTSALWCTLKSPFPSCLLSSYPTFPPLT